MLQKRGMKKIRPLDYTLGYIIMKEVYQIKLQFKDYTYQIKHN